MYSSLDKIDAVVKSPLRYVQTDHRSVDEIAANPEVTTLFALTRVLNPRAHAETQGARATIVYVTAQDELPACLRDVLAVTGASHQVGGGGTPRVYPAPETTASELADRAFRALAARVSRRVGLTDMATVLRALEAETLADPPRQDDDEAGYWTRVLELAAVTCEVVRARSGGQWEVAHHADLPFGFLTNLGGSGKTMPAGAPGPGGVILATNRAHRFIADGKDESMFLLLAADREVSASALAAGDLPVMPNLRPRREAIGSELAWRPLFPDAPEDDGFPVVVYGHDTPETFGAFRAGRAGELEVLHEQAVANVASQEVSTDDVEVEGVTLLAVSGSFYAAEKLLDRAFLRGLHRRLGHDILAASVPRRGLMFVTAVERADKRELLVLQAATRHEGRTTRAISDAILLIKDGVIAGHVEISKRAPGEPGPGDDDAPGPRGAPDTDDADNRGEADDAGEPPRKRSWFARWFGRRK